MAFIKKEEGGPVKGEPGGRFDMSKVPMAPPKAKVEQENKRNLSALPEYKPHLSDRKPSNDPVRRNRRYRGGNHIPHSVGNFQIKTVYNRDREEAKMTISTINPTTQRAWESDHSAVDWDSVERTIFEKLRRARFNIEPVPSDSGKLGENIAGSGLDHYSVSNPIMRHTAVVFNVRPLGYPVTSILTWSRANDYNPSPGSTAKPEPGFFGQWSIVKSEPSVFGNSLISAGTQESKSSSAAELSSSVEKGPVTG